jgi:hypothetical protein
VSNDSPIEYECEDILALLRAFPGRIFTRYNLARALDLSITSLHDARLAVAGVEVIADQPMRYRWSAANVFHCEGCPSVLTGERMPEGWTIDQHEGIYLCAECTTSMSDWWSSLTD